LSLTQRLGKRGRFEIGSIANSFYCQKFRLKGVIMTIAAEQTVQSVNLRPGFQDTESLRLLQEEGVNVNSCYQCSKCASGCPVSDYTDLKPIQVIHALRLGLEDLALNSELIWFCTTCETCTTRCPQEIDIAKVTSVLRILAHRRGIPSKVPGVTICDQEFLRNMKFFGRVFELGLIQQLKFKTKNFAQDMDWHYPLC